MAIREYDRFVKTEYPVRRKMEIAQLDYIKQMREEGFCGNCEKPLTECGCVMGAAFVPIDEFMFPKLLTEGLLRGLKRI
jgi:hypothetical protein